MVHPALLPLMGTHRLPVVDWIDAPADLNGLVRFAERRNLVSARVPSHFTRILLTRLLLKGTQEHQWTAGFWVHIWNQELPKSMRNLSALDCDVQCFTMDEEHTEMKGRARCRYSQTTVKSVQWRGYGQDVGGDVVVFPAKVGGVSLFKNVQTNSWTQLKKEWSYNRGPPFWLGLHSDKSTLRDEWLYRIT
jgi:hypothetical protein